MHSEPVSPELVLVDPELARRERARLEEMAALQPLYVADSVSRVAGSPVSGVRWQGVAVATKRRLAPALLMCGLFGSGVLAAELINRSHPEAAAQAVTHASPLPTRARVDSRPRGKVSVERRLASLVLSAPARKLPARFRDPATGLVRNNVQVVCSRARPGYLCVIRLPGADRRGELYVRYRVTSSRGPLFTWYGSSRRPPRR